MKLPKTIDLGAARYDILHKKHLELLGEAMNDDTELHIKKAQSPASKRDTLLHEVLHAIVWLSGWGYQLGHEDEERLVRTLTPWILAILRDNPELVAYLLDES